ncbi:MAG: hypothetical protein RSC93_02785 [Erysipelotrichaceae bacterium]
MKGYKGTDVNMCCLGFQYELGETYKLKGLMRIGTNGFHFCEKLIAIDDCYDLFTSRVFEVEAKGEIKSDRIKYCTNEIEFVRELSKEEVIELANKSVNDKNAYIRMTLAKSKLALPETLEILSEDESLFVRECVASNSKTSTKLLGILSQDEERLVRCGVASNLSTTDILLKKMCQDKHLIVRNVAKNTLEMKETNL